MTIGNFVPMEQVDLKQGFWLERYLLNKNVSVPAVQHQFENTGRFDALRFNFLKTGKRPHIFYDSDAAKWIEAVSYLMIKDPETKKVYEPFCDEMIDRMEKAQRPDGYLNSSFQQLDPEHIFKKRGAHELYCAGHLIEAAVAYDQATGKDRFLKIMERYCECIRRAFIVEKTATFKTPGHEEIELALFKLYRYTGNGTYLDMARFFLKNRGPESGDEIFYGNERYAQDDVAPYDLREANGHCVRALYWYSGLADLAREDHDERLLESLRSVWEDIVCRKLYVTGGVGSTYRMESFTVPYDLPNRTAYSESCCAIAMILFACRMRELDHSASYGNTVERILYNHLLSSTSLDGRSFFYENPLEIALEDCGRETACRADQRERLPVTQRAEVFGCSCCPPNLNRFFAEIGKIVALEENGQVFVEQYISSDIRTRVGNVSVRETYAMDGKATVFSEDYQAKTIAVRIPEWCGSCVALLNGVPTEATEKDGYAYFTVPEAFRLELDFRITLRAVAADPRVRANAGRIALTYGPLVYCLEGADNGSRLNRISVDLSDLHCMEKEIGFHGFWSFTVPAYREVSSGRLYFAAEDAEQEAIRAKFIPYFAFANRGESDMLVWVRKRG